jgi:xanthine/CO dehydrogenase XdhC/CoxF family maturation factor
MADVNEHAPGQIIVVTRNAISEAIAAIADIAGRRVVVLGDDDPEGTPRERLAADPPTPFDAVVITDHDAPEAYDLLRDAIRSPAGYVAMMASRNRTADVLTMLRAEGVDASTLDRVHLPAGLNLGGRLPGEIALSVVAEIAAWSNGRSGRPMREGESPYRPA